MSQPARSPRSPVAVVTGAGHGIGLEVVRRLAEEGMTVVLTARNEEKAAAAARGLGTGPAAGFDVLPMRSTWPTPPTRAPWPPASSVTSASSTCWSTTPPGTSTGPRRPRPPT